MPIFESRKGALLARLHSGYRESGDASFVATKRAKLVLLLAVIWGTIGLGSHAVAQQSLTYTTHTLALPSHGQGTGTASGAQRKYWTAICDALHDRAGRTLYSQILAYDGDVLRIELPRYEDGVPRGGGIHRALYGGMGASAVADLYNRSE